MKKSTKLNTEQKKDFALEKIDKRTDRQARKNKYQWRVASTRYCEKCFYSLNDDEVEHDDCLSASKDRTRNQHPHMMKILIERRR